MRLAHLPPGCGDEAKGVTPLVTTASTTRSNTRDDFVQGGRASRIYAGVRAAAAVWVLGYYAAPGTFLGRISPGGLAVDFGRTVNTGFGGICAAALFVIAIIWMACRQRNNVPNRCMPLWLTTAAFGAPLVLASVLMSVPSRGDTGAPSVLIAIATGIVAIWISQRQAVFAISAIAATQAGYAIVYHHEQINQMLSGSVLRAGGTFNQPNSLYTLMIVALPFAIAGVNLAKSVPRTFAYLAAGSAELAALVISWSRGGMMAAAVGVVVYCYLVTRSWRSSTAVLVCALVPIVAVQAIRGVGAANDASIHGANSARIREWRTGWNTFVSHPITGVGVGEFSALVTTKHKGQEHVNAVEDPKNILILMLAERGLAGAALIGLFVCGISISVKRSLPSPIAAAVGASWVSLLIAGMVDTPFWPLRSLRCWQLLFWDLNWEITALLGSDDRNALSEYGATTLADIKTPGQETLCEEI